MAIQPTNAPWLLGACNRIQMRMLEISPLLNATATRTNLGYLNFLLHPLNTVGTQISSQFGTDFKYKGTEIRIEPRYQLTDVTITPSANIQSCQGANTPNSPYFESVDVSTEYRMDFLYNLGDLAWICDASKDYILEDISRMFDAFARSVNTAVITAQAAAFGAFVDGSATKTVNLIQAGPPVSFNSADARRIRLEAVQMGYNGNIPIVGGNDTWSFFDAANYNCCNTLGIDLVKAQNGFNFFYDQEWDTIIGASALGAFIPGSRQLLTYNKYAESSAGMNPAIAMTTAIGGICGVIMDPLTGLNIDFKMTPAAECDTYKVTLSTFADLYQVPTTMFPAPDILSAGVNGSFEWIIV